MTVDLAGTVLLVDDTPSKRYVLARWLRRAGYRVVEAGTGGEALARFREGGVGLVVLDVSLPDRTGFEVCEEMKADPVHGATPVIHAFILVGDSGESDPAARGRRGVPPPKPLWAPTHAGPLLLSR